MQLSILSGGKLSEIMAILTVKLFYAFPYMNDVDLHTQIVEHVRRKIEKMSNILDKN